MKENTYCERCQRCSVGNAHFYPKECDCPCHQPPTEVAGMLCPNCPREDGTAIHYLPCPKHFPKDSVQWVEEYKRRFEADYAEWGRDETTEDAISFIKEQIAKAKEGERARIQGGIEGCLKYCREVNGRPDCKNCGLSYDILKEIGE